MMRRWPGIAILLVCLLVWTQMRGCDVQVTPTLAPTPKAQIYVYRFPIISKSGKTQLTGHGLVALNGEKFLSTLNPSWCYTYQYDDINTRSKCYTKIVHFSVPTTCPPVFFLGNEPNNTGAAGGYPADPSTAALASIAVREKCPHSFIVAPNVAGNLLNAEAWLDGYFSAGGVADSLGFHMYSIGDADSAIARIKFLRDKYARTWCLSEWGDPISVDSFTRYWDWIKVNAPCSAAWVDNWNVDPSMNLVDSNGNLTPRGLEWRK